MLIDFIVSYPVADIDMRHHVVSLGGCLWPLICIIRQAKMRTVAHCINISSRPRHIG